MNSDVLSLLSAIPPRRLIFPCADSEFSSTCRLHRHSQLFRFTVLSNSHGSLRCCLRTTSPPSSSASRRAADNGRFDGNMAVLFFRRMSKYNASLTSCSSSPTSRINYLFQDVVTGH